MTKTPTAEPNGLETGWQRSGPVSQAKIPGALGIISQHDQVASLARQQTTVYKMYGDLAIYSGTAHPELGQKIADYLGVPLSGADVFQFANANPVSRHHQSVRGKDVFIIQPTSPPTNDNLMELLIFIDTLRRDSAGRITVVVPYYGYGRTDKKDQPRVPISARLVADPDRAAKLRQVERNIGDPDFLAALEPQYGNLLRNTIAITVMRGSSKTNVISPDAVAELDCRLLPGENPDLFLATLRDVIGDESIQIETLLRFEPSESPRDTALWRAIEAAARRADPRAEVLPHVLAGFTDSHYFRERGIVSYGWSPIRMRPGDGPAPGVDEHVGVESIRRAPRILFDALMSLAASSD